MHSQPTPPTLSHSKHGHMLAPSSRQLRREVRLAWDRWAVALAILLVLSLAGCSSSTSPDNAPVVDADIDVSPAAGSVITDFTFDASGGGVSITGTMTGLVSGKIKGTVDQTNIAMKYKFAGVLNATGLGTLSAKASGSLKGTVNDSGLFKGTQKVKAAIKGCWAKRLSRVEDKEEQADGSD